MRIFRGQAAALVLVAAMGLAGCSSGGAAEDDTVAPASPHESTTTTPVEEALELLPRDVAFIDFSSDRQSAQRLKLFDDDASSATELATDFADRLSDVADTDLAALGRLAMAVQLMTEGDAAFSQLDVSWSMKVSTGEGFADENLRSVEVFRLIDGVEMTAVVDDLEDAGFQRGNASGWETFHLDGSPSDHVDLLGGGAIADRFPIAFFPDVSVHAEARLVALGEASVLDPSASSTTFDTLQPLLPDNLADLEKLVLAPSGFLDCLAPLVKMTGNRATPERAAVWSATFGIEDLGVPDLTMLAWAPGENVLHRSYFADEASAQEAIDARTRLYRMAEDSNQALGVLMPAEGNESPYEPGWTMSRDGSTVEVLHNRTDPLNAVQTYLQHGLGFDACGAPGMFS